MTGEYQLKFISIHAPRAGSDAADGLRFCKNSDFNPRSPCGERPYHCCRTALPLYFNPRSPCGERHGGEPDQGDCLEFQSTLPVRGATGRVVKAKLVQSISIHAPRAGSDHGVVVQYVGARAFQSTLPVRGATGLDTPACNAERISIHAPRAGSDMESPLLLT